MASQPLSIIADVTVVTSSPQVAAPTFNQGMVCGPSTAIPSYGTNARARQYLQATYSTAMIADGFTTASPEYICAQIYFSQSPAPQSVIIGRQDLTALQTIAIDVAGTGWSVGDQFNIVQAGASYGVGTVTAETSGVPSAIALSTQGTSYSVATGLATTAIGSSTGTGLTISVTAIGETPLQAFMACRAANAQWYPGMVTTAADADHIALSAWTLSQVGTLYLGTTSDASVANATAGNPASTIYGTSSKRTWLRYATTQGGIYPNQIYAVAMEMGQMMASNTQLAGSAFTEKFSGGVALVGGPVEPLAPSANGLTQTQISNIEGVGVNLFLNYGGSFNVLEQGTMMAPGVFFDQVLGLDVLASNIQYAIMNLLTSVPKIPQTDAGQLQLIQAVESALATSATTGFIAPGIWEGQTISLGTNNTLTAGQSLPAGYIVLSQSYASYRTSNPGGIAARIAPPIYVALIEAGAVHFTTIQVLAQI